MNLRVLYISVVIVSFSQNSQSQGVKDSDVLYKNANLLYAQGMYSEAISEYERALKQRPNDTRYLNGMGAAHLLSGQPEKAIRAYKKSCSLTELKYGLKSSRTSACKSLLSTAYEKSGKLEESIDGHRLAYESFLEQEGKDHEDRLYWLQHLINPLIRLGRYEEAIKYSTDFLSDRDPASGEYKYILKIVSQLKNNL